AAKDLDLHGARIPAGSQVLLLPGSANRDDRVFPGPDAYDLGRDTSKLISFGSGRPFCLGSPLGRLEAKAALELLVARVRPDYELAPDGISRVHSVNVRGFASLPTAVTPRLAAERRPGRARRCSRTSLPGRSSHPRLRSCGPSRRHWC